MYMLAAHRPTQVKGTTIQSPRGGGGLEFCFLINNFGPTTIEMNNVRQELFYIKDLHRLTINVYASIYNPSC